MLTEKEEMYIKLLVAEEAYFEDKLNDWEQGFMRSLVENYEDRGVGLTLSVKQWEVISRIAERLDL